MTAPIDRIENVRAQVEDVERQMEACRAAGVQFAPKMTWQLLSACKSLLGPTLDAEVAAAKAEALREAAQMLEDAANLHDHPAHQVASEALRIAQRRLELRADGIEGSNDE